MIRIAKREDGPACAEIYAPFVEKTDFTFELTAPTGDEMSGRIADTLLLRPWLVWDDGEIRGYAYAAKYRDRPAYQWCTEVSVYVRGDSHRRGIARALYGELLALLAKQGYVNAYAVIGGANAVSIAFHEAVGFTKFAVYRGVGFKLGQWRDVAWLEKTIRTRVPDPAPPTPFGSL